MKKTITLCFLFLCTLTSVALAQEKNRDKELFDEAYVIPTEKILVANLAYNRGTSTSPSLYSIERGKNETKVTFLVPIYWDSQWLHFSQGFKIIDRHSGDEYIVRGYADGFPFDRLLTVKGCNGKCIFITLLFPPLQENVKQMDIVELPHVNDKVPSNNDGVSLSFYRVKLDDYLVKHNANPKTYR